MCYDKQEPVYSAPYIHLPRNYICGHIYQDLIITHYYIVFYHFNNA
jgi:hypothetical protein